MGEEREREILSLHLLLYVLLALIVVLIAHFDRTKGTSNDKLSERNPENILHSDVRRRKQLKYDIYAKGFGPVLHLYFVN